MFGHVRLSVSCGELVLTAVEWLQLLCEELLREGEVRGSDNKLRKSYMYSGRQCVTCSLLQC